MKKVFVIFLLLFTACSHIKKAQNNPLSPLVPAIVIPTKLTTFTGDTVQYLQKSILDKKEKYIGKLLYHLLDDLELNVQSYIPGFTSRNRFISPDLTLSFYNRQETTNNLANNKRPADLIIIWETPLIMENDDNIERISKGEWTKEAKEYYSQQIVKDILTTKY
jgi:hypothetical protein